MLGASDEVARGRLVSLEGFSFAFRAKMMSGVTCNWSDDIWKFNTPCVSPTASKEQVKFVYSILK